MQRQLRSRKEPERLAADSRERRNILKQKNFAFGDITNAATKDASGKVYATRSRTNSAQGTSDPAHRPKIISRKTRTERGLSKLSVESEGPYDQVVKSTDARMLLSPHAENNNAELDSASDIDAEDAQEALAATEYVDGMYTYFREQEIILRLSPTTIMEQPNVNERMRGILVDWLIEVHFRFRLIPDTLYLAVYLIDKYMECATLTRKNFQLVGVGALLIAAKYEEIYPPELPELVYITDHAFTKHEILKQESEILIALDYFITVPTSYCFLLRYLKAARADKKVVQLSCYIAEQMLVEADMLAHLPSMVACSAVFLARRNLEMKSWSCTLEKYAGYSETDLVPCIQDICKFMKRSSKLKAAKEKFSSRQYGCIATMDLYWDF